jgi:hypothetical protein
MPLLPTSHLFYIMLALLITLPYYNTLHSRPIHFMHKIPLNKGLLLHNLWSILNLAENTAVFLSFEANIQ